MSVLKSAGLTKVSLSIIYVTDKKYSLHDGIIKYSIMCLTSGSTVKVFVAVTIAFCCKYFLSHENIVKMVSLLAQLIIRTEFINCWHSYSRRRLLINFNADIFLFNQTVRDVKCH